MTGSGRLLRIGTRGSLLAMNQAERVLKGAEGPCEIHVVTTSGDRFKDVPLGDGNPAGFFTKEIEQELLRGRIDLAVHSLKDLPVQLAEGLKMAAVLRRDDPGDILLARSDKVDRSMAIPLVKGAKVGASSRRRQALMGMFRPDIVVAPIRGNVQTRVAKAVKGGYDAVILSRAGLQRLGLDASPLEAFDLNPLVWPGAPGQAVIAVEARSGDDEAARRVSDLHDEATAILSGAERGLLMAFGGGCHAPFGAYSDGTDIVVAAPSSAAGFSVKRFCGGSTGASFELARAWIGSGCPPPAAGGEGGAWICRQARPWF